MLSLYVFPLVGLVITAGLYQADCQSYTLQPQNVTIVEGSNVTLTCWSDEMKRECSFPRLRWMKVNKLNDKGTRVVACYTVQTDFKDRMSVKLDESNKQYQLSINNIQPNDNGEYFCRMFYDDDRLIGFEVNSDEATVNVIPPTPSCTIGSPLNVAVGVNISLICSLSPNDPPSILTWLRTDPNGQLPLNRSQPTKSGNMLQAQIVLQETDYMQEFVCVAGTDFTGGPRCSLTPLLLTASISPSVKTLSEGERAEFKCNLKATLPVTADEYRWNIYKGDGSEMNVNLATKDDVQNQFDLSPKGQTLQILAVSVQDFNNVSIRCMAVLNKITYQSLQDAFLIVLPANKVTISHLIGGIFGALFLLIALLVIYLWKNKQKMSMSRRVVYQEPSREERVTSTANKPTEVADCTYQNLLDTEEQRQQQTGDRDKDKSTESLEALYALPGKFEHGEIKHFTMSQTIQADISPPCHLEETASIYSESESENTDTLEYADLKFDIRTEAGAACEDAIYAKPNKGIQKNP